MNVAIFTDNDFEKVNGVTTTLTETLRHAPSGLNLRIYTAASSGLDRSQYLALRSLGVPIPFYGEMRIYLPPVRRLRRHAIRDRIDLIHLTTPGPIGLAAMRIARQLGLPMVGSFHTDLAAYTATLSGSPRFGALMREFMRWPYGRCQRVLVPSEDTRRLLIGAKGHADRIAIWNRGVDTDLFTPALRSSATREQWGVSDRRPALLYVGRVSREKGLDLLPPLRQRLLAMGMDHRWIIAGQGPMVPALKQLMPDAYFTGVLSRSAVAAAFASADLFVFPSRTDTAGNVVLEAQASGLPVVVSATGGPREHMLAAMTGVVCEGTDVETWASAVASVLSDRGRHERMASNARSYALTRRWPDALEPLYRAYWEVGRRDESRANDAARSDLVDPVRSVGRARPAVEL